MADDAPVVETPAPAAEAAPVVAPAAEPSLLSGAGPEPKVEAKADDAASADPKPDADATKPDPAPAAAAEPLKPEDYTFTPPEGIALDDAALAPFKELAAELQIPKDKAQALIDLYGTNAKAQQTAQVEAFQAKQAEWKAEVLGLPEFQGTEGKTTFTAIGRLMDEHDPSSEVRAILDQTGMGNHPAVVKFFAGIAKQTSEGGPTSQGGVRNSGGPKTPGAILYPNQPTN